MYNKTDICQAPRPYRERMTLRIVAHVLDDLTELLSDGRATPCLYEVLRLIRAIEDEAAIDVALIGSLPATPIWLLDSKLHAIRNDVLQKQARLGEYLAEWHADGSFHILNDFGKPLAVIHANDAWLADSDGGAGPDDEFDKLNVSGVGLTSFLAYFSGEALPITASRLERWFARTEGGS